MDTSLPAHRRRNRILELAWQGPVRVDELSRLFQTSEATIRSDLRRMAREGLLERSRGGATATRRAYYNLSLGQRMRTRAAQKEAIARACAGRIRDGETLFVNAGTTTLMAVQALSGHRGLTLITNSLTVAQEAGSLPDATVILLGGWINARYQYTYGDDTLRQLSGYRADRALLSMDGVSAEGLTTGHAMEAAVDRLMVERAGSTLVLADFTKVGERSLALVAPITPSCCLVTDDGASPEALAAIAERGVEIVTAPVEEDSPG